MLQIEANIRKNALIGAAREVKQLRATALKEVDAEAQVRLKNCESTGATQMFEY